jgi:hypothetical protein
MKTAFLIQRPKASGQTITHTIADREQVFAEYIDADGDSLKWSAKFPLPNMGDEIRITMNGIGPATVVGFFEEGGYVGVMTKATNPPAWLKKQRADAKKDPRYASRPEWWKNDIGCQFGAEIALPALNWEPFEHEKAKDAGYQVWVDRGLWTVYQVTKLGEPAPLGESGYRTLDSLLKLKNIIH